MLCLGSHPKGPTLFFTCPRHALEHTRATIQEAMFELCGWPGDPHFVAAIATHTASRAHEELRSSISVRQRSSPAFWHVCTAWNLLGCPRLTAFLLPRFGTHLVDVGRWDATFVPHSGFVRVLTESKQTMLPKLESHRRSSMEISSGTRVDIRKSWKRN